MGAPRIGERVQVDLFGLAVRHVRATKNWIATGTVVDVTHGVLTISLDGSSEQVVVTSQRLRDGSSGAYEPVSA
jgi:hypothetical protein